MPRRSPPSSPPSTIPVQLGGGIRDMAGIETWLAAGVRRVILGSAAVKNPALVREACRSLPRPHRRRHRRPRRQRRDRGLGRDLHRSRPRPCAVVRGRRRGRHRLHRHRPRRHADAGSTWSRPWLWRRRLTTPVIASGGVGCAAGPGRLRHAAAGTRIEGVIVGRALYDGRVDPAAALALLSLIDRPHDPHKLRGSSDVLDVRGPALCIIACHAHARSF